MLDGIGNLLEMCLRLNKSTQIFQTIRENQLLNEGLDHEVNIDWRKERGTKL